MMANLNKPRQDGMVRIPIVRGPDANMGWRAHFPHPNDKLKPPERSYTPMPEAGLYILEGDSPQTWQYYWIDRDDWLHQLDKRTQR